jgi:hypothetical protein
LQFTKALWLRDTLNVKELLWWANIGKFVLERTGISLVVLLERIQEIATRETYLESLKTESFRDL